MKNMSGKTKSEVKKVISLLFINSVILLVGIAIAYYNTASLGYDEANLFSYDDVAIYIFDFEIEKQKIFEIIQNLKDFVPKVFITI